MDKTLHKEEFWNEVSTPFSSTKDDVWNFMESKLQDSPQPISKTKEVSLRKTWIAVASGVALILGFGAFAKLYTTDIINGSQVASSHELPDGSLVSLEPNASMSYAPIWWAFDRSLEFEGVGYFEVEKGSDFNVVSSNGTTSVLGTSFTINSTDQNYLVSCWTGKVQVVFSDSEEKYVITPGEQISKDNKKVVSPKSQESVEDYQTESVYDSINGDNLFGILNKHYNIEINSSDELKNSISFTGVLDTTRPLEETIAILEETLQISFNKEANNIYDVKASEKQ